MAAWLRLFRVVNLPTVPGDALVGAGAVMWSLAPLSPPEFAAVAMTAAASCLLYMFGLVDNDIVGAATDRGRPIPDGEISLRSARLARALCLALGLSLPAAVAALPMSSGLAVPTAASEIFVALALVAAIVAYNRRKRPFAMGLCRGLNVLFGSTSVLPLILWPRVLMRMPVVVCIVVLAALLWTVYIAAVTKYSEGEEADPARRRRVGMLIGGIVYLQIAALAVLTLHSRSVAPLLLASGVMLVLLRALKTLLPRVSAS